MKYLGRALSARASLPLLASLLALGCSSDPAPVRGVSATERSVTEATAAPVQKRARPSDYVLADIDRRPPETAVLLDKGAWGVLLEGARAIATSEGVTLAPEIGDASFTRFDRIPARFGGGFLFRTSTSLYASATFDGPLRAVAGFPGGIHAVSFGSDALLVRGSGGDRAAIDFTTGARKSAGPLGLVDVAALDDGRAIALTEAGGASVSSDGGKSWQDVRAQFRGNAGAVLARDGDLWISDNLAMSTRSLRLDRSGALAEVGAPPPAAAPRKIDPRFPNGDSPLRTALRSGVAVGQWTAVIAAGGDVMRVDLVTGAIGATVPGVVPVKMACEAIEVPEDVAFVCSERGKASVVVTGVLHGREPHVERAFPTDGPFFAGEDGALAYGGPCGALVPVPSPSASSAQGASPPAPPPPPTPTVCVRNSDGQWEPFVLDEDIAAPPPGSPGAPVKPTKHRPGAPGASVSTSSTASLPSGAKVPPSPTSVPATPSAPPRPRIRPEQVRWVPRVGRSPVAILSGNELATYDTAWGEVRPWQLVDLPSDVLDGARRLAAPRHDRDHDHGLIERRWAATPEGALRAVLDGGQGIEISTEGIVTQWPFEYQRVAVAGARAFARSNDGRAFQTLDYGHTWGEVLAPPSPQKSSFDPRECSALGCDLGAWLRVGWEQTPPAAPPELKKIARAPSLPPAPLLEMACLPTGAGESKAVQQTNESPADLGLGALRLPPPPRDSGFALDVRTLGRYPLNVPLGNTGSGAAISPRALLFGFPLTVEWSDKPGEPFGHVAVEGPSRSASSFREEVQFVEPLVPSAPVRRVSFTLDAVEKALKDKGISTVQLVSAGGFEVQGAVPVTPLASSKATSAAGDLLLSFSPGSDLGTLFVLAHGGSAPRAEVLFAQPGGIVESAAQLAGGGIAALAADSDGAETVLRFGSSGVTEIARLAPPPDSHLAPANPDAIAIGPHGEIAVIRTPSGSDPPSAADPALLILPGPKLTALAPWSAAVSADDPACAQATDMYRATIQTTETWLRIVGHPTVDGTTTGMTARVRWSASKLCIEAIEAPESTGVTQGLSTENIMVATFAPGAAGRSEISLGREARTPFSCALGPR